jgi:raffinose/stachyose/melibiose transport system permease protein/N-acetylglucosamine transport system permease protein
MQGSQAPRLFGSQTRYTISRELKRIHLYILPVLWSVFNIFCVYWIVASSLKDNRTVFSDPWGLPANPQFQNYAKIWELANLGGQLWNSIVITGVSVLAILVICTPAAYVLSRFEFKASGILLPIFVAGAGVPAAMLIIPLFVMLTQIKLINTITGLIIIYITLSIPFSMFVLTGFLKTIPKEFEDAARIDGCSEFQVFSQVILPLASPGMLTVAIFNFVAIWNEYAMALVFIQNQAKMPLARGIYAIAGSMIYTGNWVGLFAAVVIVMIPSLLVYIILSERMIQGITAGALK